jgi:hypothetical protein
MSQVFFIAVNEQEAPESVLPGLEKLVSRSGLLEAVPEGTASQVKIHFGEEGNTGFVRPEYVRAINRAIRERGSSPVLSDTNTLYRGRRTRCADHLALAEEHGFTGERAGAPVLIPDDSDPENVRTVSREGRFVREAHVVRAYLETDFLVGVAHFKGHLMTGIGGALKNIGMGCASREGKLAQHSDVSPIVHKDACTGCGACVAVCPVDAIRLKDSRAHLDRSLCIGCASCLAACEYQAVDVDWMSGGSTIQQKMVEYARAVLEPMLGKCVFFNFALKITKECDCLAKDDPRIVPDIGIFASSDPVSLDKACYDRVEEQAGGRDVFREAHPLRNGKVQLEYAAELGLGSLEYELIEL